VRLKLCDAVKRYQEQFFASLPPETNKAPRFVEPVAFGFTPQDATEISKLVLDGVKTATGSLLWSYQADGKSLPRVGDPWVVIDGELQPGVRRPDDKCRQSHSMRSRKISAVGRRRRLLAGELAPNVLEIHRSGMQAHRTRADR